MWPNFQKYSQKAKQIICGQTTPENAYHLKTPTKFSQFGSKKTKLPTLCWSIFCPF